MYRNIKTGRVKRPGIDKMAKRKKWKREFVDLTWDDLEDWAGSKIVSRCRNYQRQGRVSELAKIKDNCLIAWVEDQG